MAFGLHNCVLFMSSIQPNYFQEKREVKFPNRIRIFNKRYLNQLTGKIARSSRGPFCIIGHVGRRSGKTYETPIIAIPTTDGFVVALTYGPEVDWYRNISAAGRCKILWHRREYAIGKIEPMEIQAALPHFPWLESMILRLLGTQHFIRMTKG